MVTTRPQRLAQRPGCLVNKMPRHCQALVSTPPAWLCMSAAHAANGRDTSCSLSTASVWGVRADPSLGIHQGLLARAGQLGQG